MSVTPAQQDVLRSFSPQSPRDLIGEFRTASASGVQQAVDRARAAHREWWELGAAGRAGCLARAARQLEARREEAAALVVREVGKPAAEAAGEVARAISILDYYAQAAYAATGEVYPPSSAGLLITQRRPYGVAGLITPWNFPLAIPLWKAAPALAAGNAVVLKPSPESPGCAELLAALFAGALPEYCFAVVQGGSDTGRALVDSADVVSFTGSDRVGRGVAAQAAGRSVSAQCEMGGQNAAIVLEDADTGPTARLVALAAMGYAGQKCTATRRVIVVGEGRDFGPALIEAVRSLAPQPPDAEGAVVGPLISEPARERVLRAVAEARAAGGRVLAGGEAPDGEGWYVEPTLIDDLPADHALSREETFGPVATVHHVRGIDEAVELANSVRFGLVTSLHGRDLDRLLLAAGALQSGLIRVNAPTTGVEFYAPFGGEKDSSYGPREQGLAGLEFFSSSRTITIAPHGR